MGAEVDGSASTSDQAISPTAGLAAREMRWQTPERCATMYRVIVTVRQQFADSFPHYITQERNDKSSKYKTLEHLKAYGGRHSAPTLSVKCCRISTLTLYSAGGRRPRTSGCRRGAASRLGGADTPSLSQRRTGRAQEARRASSLLHARDVRLS